MSFLLYSIHHNTARQQLKIKSKSQSIFNSAVACIEKFLSQDREIKFLSFFSCPFQRHSLIFLLPFSKTLSHLSLALFRRHSQLSLALFKDTLSSFSCPFQRHSPPFFSSIGTLVKGKGVGRSAPKRIADSEN
jgi:hypothetical protein